MLGGWIESENNLPNTTAQTAWVGDTAKVYGEAAVVRDSAQVYGAAEVYEQATVADEAQVYDSAQVLGHSHVHCHAQIYKRASVKGLSSVTEYARVYGKATVCDYANVGGRARVYGRAFVGASANIVGRSQVFGSAAVLGNVFLDGQVRVSAARLDGYTRLTRRAVVAGKGDYLHLSGLYFEVTIQNDGYATIGCQTKPIAEWLDLKLEDQVSTISKVHFQQMQQILRPLFKRALKRHLARQAADET